MGANGIRGELTVMPGQGSLMDAAGQLASTWILLKTETDRLSMPVKVGSVRYYSPEPAIGEKVECRVIIRDFGAREVRSDIELWHDGKLHARVDDWEDWRFYSGAGLFSVMRYPERNVWAEHHPGGFVFVEDPNRAFTTVVFLAGRFLAAAEIADIKEIENRRRQIEWLYGRIAAKDAIRTILFEKGKGAIYPVEVTVRSDANGKPIATGPYTEDLRVSIAHTAGLAVAYAVEGADPGIDVEKIAARTDNFAAIAFADEELALLPSEERDEWMTRLWCAKEAVGKARGTGLQGAPKKLQLEDLDGERLLVDGVWVRTTRMGDYVIGWTQI
jgi:phosphopantetheinyl transferase